MNRRTNVIGQTHKERENRHRVTGKRGKKKKTQEDLATKR